jgi:hypothetical protein
LAIGDESYRRSQWNDRFGADCYQFYKRQAQDDPNVWLSLGGATGIEPGTAASN